LALIKQLEALQAEVSALLSTTARTTITIGS